MTGADVVTEEQIGFTIIFFLDPTSSRYQSYSMVSIVSAKLPDKEIIKIMTVKVENNSPPPTFGQVSANCQPTGY